MCNNQVCQPFFLILILLFLNYISEVYYRTMQTHKHIYVTHIYTDTHIYTTVMEEYQQHINNKTEGFLLPHTWSLWLLSPLLLHKLWYTKTTTINFLISLLQCIGLSSFFPQLFLPYDAAYFPAGFNWPWLLTVGNTTIKTVMIINTHKNFLYNCSSHSIQNKQVPIRRHSNVPTCTHDRLWTKRIGLHHLHTSNYGWKNNIAQSGAVIIDLDTYTQQHTSLQNDDIFVSFNLLHL